MLADLIREALTGERQYAVAGDEWHGWWTGRLPDGRQVLAAFTGRSAAEPGEHPTLHMVLFDAAGRLRDVVSRPDPLPAPPPPVGPAGEAPPLFDPATLERYLTAALGGFERAAVRVRPFAAPEIGMRLNPLLDTQVGFLADPAGYDADEQDAIREWLAGGGCELVFGADYFLDGDGAVASS